MESLSLLAYTPRNMTTLGKSCSSHGGTKYSKEMTRRHGHRRGNSLRKETTPWGESFLENIPRKTSRAPVLASISTGRAPQIRAFRYYRRAIRLIRCRLRSTGIRGNLEATGVLKFLLGFYETAL